MHAYKCTYEHVLLILSFFKNIYNYYITICCMHILIIVYISLDIVFFQKYNTVLSLFVIYISMITVSVRCLLAKCH